MSSTFLGLCKCIPQVRQVVYQAGCAVLKLRVSDTGMQQSQVGGEQEEGVGGGGGWVWVAGWGGNSQSNRASKLTQTSFLLLFVV